MQWSVEYRRLSHGKWKKCKKTAGLRLQEVDAGGLVYELTVGSTTHQGPSMLTRGDKTATVSVTDPVNAVASKDNTLYIRRQDVPNGELQADQPTQFCVQFQQTAHMNEALSVLRHYCTINRDLMPAKPSQPIPEELSPPSWGMLDSATTGDISPATLRPLIRDIMEEPGFGYFVGCVSTIWHDHISQQVRLMLQSFVPLATIGL